VPWILGVHRVEPRLIHPWVSGFKFHAFEYNVEKYLKVDPELRAKSLK